eukprot:613050-Amorphochlora_amoeboformis.AAC.1
MRKREKNGWREKGDEQNRDSAKRGGLERKSRRGERERDPEIERERERERMRGRNILYKQNAT